MKTDISDKRLYLSELGINRQMFYKWKEEGLLILGKEYEFDITDYERWGQEDAVKKWNTLSFTESCWYFLVEMLRNSDVPYDTIHNIKETYGDRFENMVDEILSENKSYWLYGPSQFIFTSFPETVLLAIVDNPGMRSFALHIIVKNQLKKYESDN